MTEAGGVKKRLETLQQIIQNSLQSHTNECIQSERGKEVEVAHSGIARDQHISPILQGLG